MHSIFYNIILKYIFTIGLSLFSFCANAQKISYINYTKANGLASNEVYDLLVDKVGFLWIATDDGLVKYNGDVFTTYKNFNSKGNAVSYLQQDKQGKIWCSSFNGQIFYIENDSLKIFNEYEKFNFVAFPEIFIKPNNELFASNRTNNYYTYNLTANKSNTGKTFANSAIINLCVLYDSTFCITTNIKGLFKLAFFKNNILDTINIPLIEANNFYKVSNNSILKLSICYSYQIVNKRQELQLWFYQNGQFEERRLANFYVTKMGHWQSLLLNNDSSAFVGTTKGLFKIANIYNSLSSIECIIKDINISKIIEDNHHNIWISSLANGILKLTNNKIGSINFDTENSKQEFIFLASNKNNIVIGITTHGLLHYYNTTTQKHLKTQLNDVSKVQNLFFDERKNKFIVCQSKAYELQITTNQLQLTEDINNYTNVKKVMSSKNNDKVYMGGGLNIIKSHSHKLHAIEKQRGYDICIDTNNFTIWFASINGLKLVDTNYTITFLKDENNNTIYSNKVTKDAHYMYASTFNNGIFVFSNNKLYKHLSNANMLASNNVRKIVCNPNYLAVLYENEVDIIDCQKFEVAQTISPKLGSKFVYINDIAITNQQLYIASNNGIQYFAIKANKLVQPSSIFISKIVVDKTLMNNLPTSFSYNTKKIAITFSGVDLNSNSTFKYFYRLLPNDSAWLQLNNENTTIEFENLKSGDYCLEYKLVTNHFNSTNTIYKYNFIVTTPFWKKWYFIALVITLFLVLVIYTYKYQIKRLQKKHTQQLAQVVLNDKLKQAQLSALKVQMNPHFIFNTLNSIQDFILLNEKENANFYLGKFSKLMRMVLDMSNKEQITFKEEIELLKVYLELEALRFDKDFYYKISGEDKLSYSQDSIEFPPLLIQPFVENAIKHGLLHRKGKKVLFIDFTLEDDILTCTINDNGVGRKISNEINAIRQKSYASFATNATKNRLDLINSVHQNAVSVTYIDKKDKEDIAIGTEVIVKIAIKVVYK